MKRKSLKRLYICDTPLQLFNACNQQFHEREIESDLIVVDHFADAEPYSEKLRKSGLFRQICVIRYDGDLPETWIGRRIYNYKHFFHIDAIIRKELEQQGFCEYESYDVVAASYLIETAIAMLHMNPAATFMLFDDGLGSYAGNLITDFWSKKYILFSRIFQRGCFIARPKTLYLNNVSCCRSELGVELEQLPPLDKGYLSLAERIFGKAELPEKRIILLSQPIETGICRRNIEDMIECLKQFSDSVVVRLHPRDKDDSLYSRYFETIKGTGLWELAASSETMNQKILISIGSTAQFVPKIMFDQEPYIVFFYPFSKGYSMGFGKGMNDMVDLLKETYRNPGKICVPRTFDDVSSFLYRVLV